MALYLVATPIGNLKDITFRAVETLKTADVILVEKWSDSIKLLNHFAIKPPKLIRYDEQNKKKITPQILELAKVKSVVLITSAGMPGISDPGADLVSQCHQQQIPVIPIPGPSALTAAIAASGFRGDFLFASFLPKKRGQIEKMFKRAYEGKYNLVFFESVYRLKKTLEILSRIRPDANVFIGKEMTKKFESYLTGSPAKLLELFKKDKSFLRGEFTVVVK